jgi:hypothetical protein
MKWLFFVLFQKKIKEMNSSDTTYIHRPTQFLKCTNIIIEILLSYISMFSCNMRFVMIEIAR